jgi:hypothetical protein
MALADRKKRIELHLPMAVDGRDESGLGFREESRTQNISGGGVCFETQRHLPVGGRLALEIRIPEGLQRHFGGHPVYRVKAVVCRVERFEEGKTSRIGARFLGETE